MGFRGSRVQIPPSRLIDNDLQTAKLARARLGPVSQSNSAVSPLPLLAHSGEERFVIWPGAACQQCHGVFPTARLGNVGHGQVLPFRRPLPPVRMPESAVALLQSCFLLSMR